MSVGADGRDIGPKSTVLGLYIAGEWTLNIKPQMKGWLATNHHIVILGNVLLRGPLLESYGRWFRC